MRHGTRFYWETTHIAFDIYDNEEKRRLQTGYPTGKDAEKRCKQLNIEWLQRSLTVHLL